MDKTKDLEKRLKYISELIDETFFEHNEEENYSYIPDKYKEYKSVIWEVFYVAAMGEWVDYRE